MTDDLNPQPIQAVPSQEEVPEKYRGRTPHLRASLDKEELKDRFAEIEFDGKLYYVDEPSLNKFIDIQALMDEMEGEELTEEEAMEGISNLREMLIGIAPTFKDCDLNFRRIQKIIQLFAELVQMPEDEALEQMGVKSAPSEGDGQKKEEDSLTSVQ